MEKIKTKKKCIYNKELDDELRIKKEDLPYYLNNGYKLGRRPFSNEHKQKMRGPKSEETKRKIRETETGKIVSEETKKKQSEAQTGLKYIYNKKLDIETKVKKEDLLHYLNNGYRLGRRPFSDEHKQNGAKARTGLKRSEKTKEKQRKIRKGKTYEELFGEEKANKYKQSLSEAQKETKRIYNEELDIETTIKKEEIPYYLNIGYILGKRPFSEETKRNQRLAAIKRIENNIKNGGQISPSYNSDACKYFDLLMEQTNTFIQHAENEGEFSILGYFVDGYDKINNIVYEYDEEHHYKNEKLREKDIQRQKEITKHLNCEFIRIKEVL